MLCNIIVSELAKVLSIARNLGERVQGVNMICLICALSKMKWRENAIRLEPKARKFAVASRLRFGLVFTNVFYDIIKNDIGCKNIKYNPGRSKIGKY